MVTGLNVAVRYSRFAIRFRFDLRLATRPSQLMAFARILAELVLPNPFGPVNKNAWGISFAERIEVKRVRTDSKSSSDIFCGLYFL